MLKFTNNKKKKIKQLILKLFLILLFSFLNPTLCDTFCGDDDTWSSFFSKYKTLIIAGTFSCFLIGAFVYFFNTAPPSLINDFPVTTVDIILNSISEIVEPDLFNKIVCMVVQAGEFPDCKFISIGNLEKILENVPLNQVSSSEMNYLIFNNKEFRELLIELISELKKD